MLNPNQRQIKQYLEKEKSNLIQTTIKDLANKQHNGENITLKIKPAFYNLVAYAMQDFANDFFNRDELDELATDLMIEYSESINEHLFKLHYKLNDKQVIIYKHFKDNNAFRNKQVNRMFKILKDMYHYNKYNPTEVENLFVNIVVSTMKNFVKTNNKLPWHELLTVNERKELATALVDNLKINGGNYKQPPKCDEYGNIWRLHFDL